MCDINSNQINQLWEDFTKKEKDIIKLWCRGYSSIYIIKELNIKASTYNTYITHIYNKLFPLMDMEDENYNKKLLCACAFIDKTRKN